MNLSKKEITIVVILALLTALEALSIDLYLPAFQSIAEDLNADIGKVQVSLAVFLGGFAVGQLLWGPLSDRFGRKWPMIGAIAIYTVASLLVLTVSSIEELWLFRFIQAFSGSAGVVIARAVVTDIFDKKRTTSIFALLALIIGVAPIIAPGIGNLLVKQGNWHNVFLAMGILGAVATLSVIFLLPETLKKAKSKTKSLVKRRSVVASYLHVFSNKQFVIYTLVGSMAYSGLMVYISNSPFLIMEKGGFSGTQYSLIFGANAVGMMMATYAVNFLMKIMSLREIVKYFSFIQVLIGCLLVVGVLANLPVNFMLVMIFLYLMPTGILFPTTTDLALESFQNDSGTASAVFGFSQLAVTFVVAAVIGLVQGGTVAPMVLGLFFCALASACFSIFYASGKSVKRAMVAH